MASAGSGPSEEQLAQHEQPTGAAGASATPPPEQQQAPPAVDPNATLAEQIAASSAGGGAQWVHEATAAQYDAIQRQVQAEQSLVTDKLPVDVLRAEFANADDPEMRRKAEHLCDDYTAVRRVRGDGSCFYRALCFAAFELAAERRVDAAAFARHVHDYRRRFKAVGFDDIIDDFCDTLETLLRELVEQSAGVGRLLEQFNTDELSNSYVYWCRLVTSCYLKEHRADYEPFVESFDNIDAYCRAQVEPIGKECDHLEIQALTKALDVPLRIVYLDRAPDAGGRCQHYLFAGDSENEVRPPRAVFLYRPGHYDILYTVDAAANLP